ncbi:MAG: NHLP bacteriocin export ABC transporter permease/ATPase subunit [Armatimonadetes bacterium]|nr:NHLP bacteriocin export ABC transporter permease/ATPase subunit [Armatimonadota bacterium]
MHAREPAGQPVEIAGNQPLLLHDGDAAWLVETGRVHVFAVRMAGGQPAGTRHHLCSAEPGDALLGISPPADGSLGLLATGVPGTRLVRLDLKRFLDASQVDSTPLIERWVHRLSAVVPDRLPPRHFEPLPRVGQVTLADAGDARPEQGVAWVRVVDGHVLFAGIEGLGCDHDDGTLPLSSQAWLRAMGPATLQVQDAEGVRRADGMGAGLQRFHRLVMAGMALRLEAAARDEAERLARKAGVDRAALRDGMARLAAAYDRREAAAALLVEEQEDLLLAAARLVGDAMGIAIQAPPRSEARRQQVDPLGSIARASRVRFRPVTLSGEWWRRDNGPLLASWKDAGRPVAVVPTSATAYDVVEPADGARRPVTPAVAALLSPDAHVFYRPFTAGRLGLRELARLGLRGAGRDLLTMGGVGILGGLLGMATPLATGYIVDKAIPSADHGRLLVIAMGLVASALGAAAFQLTRSIAMMRVQGKMEASIEAAVWDRLLNLPAPFFRTYSSGDLAMRAMGIGMLLQTLKEAVLNSVLTSMFSVFSFGLLFVYDVRLGLLATLALIAIFGLTAAGNYIQFRYLEKISDLGGRLSSMELEFITGITKLRVAAAEARGFAVWARTFADRVALDRKVQALSVTVSVFNTALPLLTTMGLFAWIAFRSGGSLSTGAFLAFNAAFGQVLAAALSFSSALLSSLQVLPLLKRARPILDASPEVDVLRPDPGEFSGEIEVNHVSFRYQPDGPLILDDVSLHARPGQFVAIVGPSGSGKSTLLRLLLGFESPESGSILYDGKDLAGVDVRAARRQIGVVLQGGKLMPGDIHTNIVGSSRLSVDDAWEAARMAGLDRDIEGMPMGMFTIVMEGGTTLSGGQRQRLMIARALVTRPRIIFFDEATSALDNQTQAVVSRSLESLQATRMVIAHRLSTIMKADRIYVMEKGRVVQHGTYEELIQQPGLFAELAKRQLA